MINKFFNISIILIIYIVSILLVAYKISYYDYKRLDEIIHEEVMIPKENGSTILIRPYKDNLPPGISSLTDKIGSRIKKIEELILLFLGIFILLLIIKIFSYFKMKMNKGKQELGN